MKNNHFFAVKIPEEQKMQLYNFINEKRNDYPFKNWVHPLDYHITLAFLGKVAPFLLRESVRRVQHHLSGEKSFRLTIRRLGVFGAKTSPRVFWADVFPSEDLTNIHEKVYLACLEAGVQLNQRPFRPHITLARKWIGEHPFSEHLLLPVEQKDGTPISFKVQEIVLYESKLTSTPKYQGIERFSLL